MATRGADVTSTPANLITAVTPNLDDGQSYTVENVGAGAILYASAASAPAISDSWHVLVYGASVGITVDAAEPLWVRTPASAGGHRVSVTEAE